MSTTGDGAEQMVRQCRNCGRLPAEDEVICEDCGFADFILGPAASTPDSADTAATGVGPMTQTADGAAPSAGAVPFGATAPFGAAATLGGAAPIRGASAPPAQARTLRATFLSSAIGSDQHYQVDVQPGAHVLLGRDPEVSPHADFLSRDDTVSRRHAVIGVSGAGSPWVRDAYSTNGTFVNNTALPPGGEAPLGNGDRLRLGQGIFAKIQLILAGAEGDGHDGGA